MMTEDIKRRILVVEDKPNLLYLYKLVLEEAGFLVDTFDTKSASIEALRSKIYDLALVDLQLKDDISHKGGHDVLDAINDLQDGTVAIVVSGTHEIRDSIASYSRGIATFIMKGDIKPEDLVDPIKKALEKHVRPQIGDFPSLSAYLARPEQTPIWQGQVENTLGCGYPNLDNILWKSLQPYLPLIRKKDGSPSLAMDKERRAVGGLFWSKELGCAIWFSAAGKGVFIDPAETDVVPLGNFTGKNVSGAVWKVKAGRDEFLERISDRPGPKI
jgi:ActR/RegA family two-component response regulator